MLQSETSARDRRAVLRQQTTVTFCYTVVRCSRPSPGAAEPARAPGALAAIAAPGPRDHRGESKAPRASAIVR